jgi:ABC transport system ATP-binding/permease protein
MSTDPFELDPPTEVAGDPYIISTLLVGSDHVCDIVIDHPSVSPYHINVSEMSDGRYLIEDLGSDEGTFVHGYLETRAMLDLEDVIQLGRRPVEILYFASFFGADVLLDTEDASTAELMTELKIGSDPNSNIHLDLPVISPSHATITLDNDGIRITDLHSDFGTFVNGTRIYGDTILRLHDRLMLGGYPIPRQVLRQWWLMLVSAEQKETKAKLHSAIPLNGSLLIGRSPDCEITVDHPTVSWNHAKLIVRDGIQEIVDLGSANGTFVDERLVRRCFLRPKGKLRLGAAQVPLSQSHLSKGKISQEIRISADGVKRELKNGLVILDTLSLSILPGEMVALMGPSGAGKTTLLEILSGKTIPQEGRVLLNEKDIFSAWEEFRHSIGYVPQDDILHRDLTVFEVLFHAARLRLPADVPKVELTRQIDSLLTRMGLAHIRESIIGDEHNRGISGGQRKRVNIAIELLTEPSLLFLDEPTSGLDAKSTLEVMSILRQLASNGKTIIMTIHQPRLEAFEMLDNLILMSKGGKLAYYGPASNAVSFTAEHSGRTPREDGNPADFVIDTLENPKVTSDEWKNHYIQSEYYKSFVESRLADQKQITHELTYFARPFFSQFINLFNRYSKRKLRDHNSLLIQLAQAPVIGLLLGFLFTNSGGEFRGLEIPAALEKIPVLIDLLQLQNGIHPTLFLISAASFWLGCSNVARELVSGRAIFLREKRAGLRSSAYLMAIFTYQVLLCMIQTLLISGFVAFYVDLSAPFFNVWGLLILTGASGISIGLLISSFSKTEIAAISFIPIILIPQLMLAGYIKLYGLLQEVPWQNHLADLMPIRWSFEALTIMEYQAAGSVHPHLHPLRNVVGFQHLSLERPIEVLILSILLFTAVCLAKLNAQK